jgi:hypothetical protein
VRLPEAGTPDRWHLVAVALVSVVFLFPIWFTGYPPLLDWPNHLARAYVLARYAKVPEFQNAFEVRWDLLPNLGVDILGTVLLYWLPYSLTSKIILSLALLLFVAGCIRVSLGFHQRVSLTTVIALYFAYNFMFFYGFVNYALGIGLFLLTYGYWLRSGHSPSPKRLFHLTLLGVCCFFSHISAFVFLILALGTHVVVSLVQRKLTLTRMANVAASVALPTVLFAIYNLKYSERANSLVLRWEGIQSKLKGFAYLFASYDFGVDVLFAGLLLLLLLLRLRSLPVKPHSVGAVVGFVYLLSFLAFPTAGYVGTWAIDRRFVVPAVVITLLSVGVLHLPMRKYLLLLTLATMLVIVRVGWIWSQWSPLSKSIHQQVNLFQQMFSRGDWIYPIVMLERQDKLSWVKQMAFGHVICYAVVTRNAITPSLFAYEGQQPIRFRDPHLGYTELFPPFPSPDKILDIALLKTRYDYIYGFRLTADYERYLSQHFNLVHRDKDVWVFATKQQTSFTSTTPTSQPKRESQR